MLPTPSVAVTDNVKVPSLAALNTSPELHAPGIGSTIPGPLQVHVKLSGPPTSSLSVSENDGDPLDDGEARGVLSTTVGGCAMVSTVYVAVPAGLAWPRPSVAITLSV